ncbi:hypothetical protein DFR50_1344 [Roseiarcus fermentans]|uniref:Uncharacterized protein n=1 Tax=Roseiarcus fermentans TaxID=1473586 RepID=A0A366ETD0_9HYPH|nr:hypothetical protein DFR50_1344 [Roseiarcus fermentans]
MVSQSRSGSGSMSARRNAFDDVSNAVGHREARTLRIRDRLLLQHGHVVAIHRDRYRPREQRRSGPTRRRWLASRSASRRSTARPPGPGPRAQPPWQLRSPATAKPPSSRGAKRRGDPRGRGQCLPYAGRRRAAASAAPGSPRRPSGSSRGRRETSSPSPQRRRPPVIPKARQGSAVTIARTFRGIPLKRLKTGRPSRPWGRSARPQATAAMRDAPRRAL